MKTTLSIAAFALVTTSTSSAALWTPADITTAAWYDADDSGTISHTANAVTQWNDKSGNALHAISPLANAPKYDASYSGLNNMGSIGYDPGGSTSRYIDTPTVTGVGQIYFVVNWELATFNNGSTVDKYLINAVGNADRKIHGKQGLTIWDASSSINGQTGSYFRDGATPSTTTALTMENGAVWRSPYANGDAWFRLLNDASGPSTGETWQDGALGEVIFTDGTEDLDTQLKIEGYLAHKWGLEGALPSDHLYKALAPGGAVAVPEPSTTALLGLGGLALVLRRRK